MLESAPGTSALYDFGARSYNPALGAFIGLDGVHGSAQNPALLNGYLYANANPATLVDPDGHAAYSGCPIQYCGTAAQKAANAAADKQAWGTMQQTVAQTRQFAAAQVGALSAGCPVQYCGTSDQKEHSATLDTATRAAMQYVALTKFAASAKAVDHPSVSAQPGRPECGGNPLCAINNAIGTAGDVAGGVWNTVSMPVMFAGAAALCAAGGELDAIQCLPLIGLLAYTGANGVNNASKLNPNFLEGWNPADAGGTALGMTAIGGLVAMGAGAGTLAIAGFAIGFTSDLASQQAQHLGGPVNVEHALCSGAVGGISGYLTKGLDALGIKDASGKGFAWDVLSTVYGNQVCSGGH